MALWVCTEALWGKVHSAAQWSAVCVPGETMLLAAFWKRCFCLPRGLDPDLGHLVMGTRDQQCRMTATLCESLALHAL